MSKLQPEVAPTFFAMWIPASVVWMLIALALGESARAEEQRILDSKSGVSHWWGNGALFGTSDPEKAHTDWVMRGILGIVLLGLLCRPIAGGIVNARRASASERQERMRQAEILAEREREQAQVVAIEAESTTAAQLSLNARSKREVITRLGSLDQFIRVLEYEQNPDRRILALQSGQNELVSLEARIIAGEIDSEALRDDRIRAHLRETSMDLRRIGLGADRLHKDLLRIFGASLPSTTQRPEEQNTATAG